MGHLVYQADVAAEVAVRTDAAYRRSCGRMGHSPIGPRLASREANKKSLR